VTVAKAHCMQLANISLEHWHNVGCMSVMGSQLTL